MEGSACPVGVQVAQQGDLRAVVDDLAGDVGDQVDHRFLGVCPLRRATGPVQPVLAQSAYPVDPGRVRLVELESPTSQQVRTLLPEDLPAIERTDPADGQPRFGNYP